MDNTFIHPNKKDDGTIILRCPDKCSMLVVDKYTWYHDNTVCYDISMQDACYDKRYNTLRGRIKRACKVLFGKPHYYNDMYFPDEESIIEFRDALTRLIWGSGNAK